MILWISFNEIFSNKEYIPDIQTQKIGHGKNIITTNKNS